MGNDYKSHGVYEHKTGAGEGIIHRDKSSYAKSKGNYIYEHEQASFLKENSPPAYSPMPLAGVISEENRSSPSYNAVNLQKTDTSNQISETERSYSTVPDDPGVFTPTSSSDFISPNVPISPASDLDAGEIKGTEMTFGSSFLNNVSSFQASESTDNPKMFSTERVTFPAGETHSDKSRYFKESNKGTDIIPNGIAPVGSSNNYVKSITTESQLNLRGISGIDVVSPFIDIAREDDTGGEVIADIYGVGEKTVNTIKKLNNSSAGATSKPKKAPAGSASTAQATSKTATSSAVETGAVRGGTKVAQSAPKAPPIVYLWILVGVVVTAFLLMIFGASSFAVTQVTFSSGSESDNVPLVLQNPNLKNSTDLVLWCKWASENKHGYVYGAFGQICTVDYLDQQASRYPGNEEAGGDMRIVGEKWINKPVYDCIGLIKAYAWYDNETGYITYGTNDFIDVSANTIWDYVNTQESGNIEEIPETPGIAVWMQGHIGVYIGNGEVIEAQGTATGVVQTKLENGSWTHWFKIPWIEYPVEPTTDATAPLSPIEPTE